MQNVSEERYRLIASVMSDYVFSVQYGADGSVTDRWIDGALERITGYAPQEFFDRGGWLSILHPDDRDQDRQDMRELLANHQVVTDVRIIRRDGGVRWVRVYAHPQWEDKENRLVGIFGAVQDITERRRIEDALRASEIRYRAIVESTTDLICRFLPDTTLTFVNEAYCGYFGKSRDQLVGTRFLALIPEGDWADVQNHIAMVLRMREPVTYSHEVITPQGEICWQQWMDSAILDEDGEVVELQSIGRDITDQKRTEEELRTNEERLQQAIRLTSTGSFDHNHITDFIYWSPEVRKAFGIGQGETFTLQEFLGHVHPDDVEALGFAIQKAHDPGGDGSFDLEYRFIRPDGMIRWFAAKSQTSFDGVGGTKHPVRTVGALIDITERKQIDADLRESRNLLRSVLDTIPVRIFWKDLDLKYLGCNRPFALDAGLQESEGIVGRDDYQMGWKDQADLYRSDDRQVIESGIPKLDYEEPQTSPDGRHIWLQTSKIPLRKDNGAIYGVLGTYQDITERKRAISELHQRAEEVALLYRLGAALSGGENLYQALRAFVRELKQVMAVDAFHIGVYDEKTDVFSYTLFLNLDEDLYPPPRILRESPGLTWEVISFRKTLYLPDVRDPQVQRDHNIYWVVEAPIRTYLGMPLVLQDRVIGIMSVQSIQTGAYTSDQIRLLETIAAQVALTIEKLSLLEQVQKELAERKKAEAGLQQREAILEVVAEAANTFLKVPESSAGSWRMEVDNLLERLGNAIHASHAYIFENRLTRDGSIRMSMHYEWTAPGFLSDLGDPKYIDMPIDVDSLESWATTILRGLPFIGDPEHCSPADMENLRKRGIHALLDVPIFIDGKWWGTIGFDEMSNPRNWSAAEVDALVVAANLVGAAVKRRQMDSILQDELQKRKTLIEELENKNAELERFTYTVSHDLRSPLVTIRGFLGYLEKHMRDGNLDAFRADVERISNATLQMDSLLKDLLELSRIGRLINRPQDVLFGELVRDALEIVHGRLESRGITLQTQPDLPTVHVDRARLTEVLQNLLDNAAKYMGDQQEPEIEIGCEGRDPSNHFVFFVRDNGMGIAPEYHERIFGLFDKLDASSEGTGVGLALVKRIIEFHGGRVWVESGLGRGSTFFFTLPGGRINPGSAETGPKP